jgi:hypothetical protein
MALLKTFMILRIGHVCNWRGMCGSCDPSIPFVSFLRFLSHTDFMPSDILAELDLPASGISRSEARISLPKGRFTLNLPNEISAPNTMMMFFYSAQIHLRKVLNRVHTDLYKVDSKK